MTVETWYRFEDRRVANYDPWAGDDQPHGSHVVVNVLEFALVKRTPKGVWLKHGGMGRPRFVLDAAHKRFACPTLEAAYASFRARKAKQISIYQAREAGARDAVAAGVRELRRRLGRAQAPFTPEEALDATGGAVSGVLE